MRLIGLFDSPYVRRVAIALRALGLPFDHEPLSVFRDFDRFAAVNPIVKAPTLIVEDGTMLIDSTLILTYLERIAAPGRSLVPEEAAAFLASQRIIGLALAACEKTVQIVYENKLRPADKQHQPWLDRVEGQLLAAYDLLETAYAAMPSPERLMQADITAAVAWRFTAGVLPGVVEPARCPALAALSAAAEARPEFLAVPFD